MQSFFKETGNTPLETQILTSIQQMELCSDDVATQQEQFRRYLQDEDYKKVSPRLQRALQKTLRELDARAKDASEPSSETCFVQIPSKTDITSMKYMPAGGEEDQQTRLQHMAEHIEKHSDLPIVTTEHINLAKHWIELFALIDSGEERAAFQLLNKMNEDIILKAILRVHPLEYLKAIITYSIEAQAKGLKILNSDIIITPKTFELLIRDVATTLLNQAKLHFSFGLPSHHAFNSEGTGFCIFNKTAILMRHAEHTHIDPLNYIIVGTDVNRDNGFCGVLRRTASHLNICHVDVFDSRVYPHQDHTTIDKEFKLRGKVVKAGIQCWAKENFKYFAVDLSAATRKKPGIHPALLFALEQIEKQVINAKTKKQKVMIYLPTGWDSHEDETAYCGKLIDGEIMTKAAAKQSRFNDKDLTYFYENILRVYQENPDCIAGIYWGLEGGYDRPMYEKQIELMLHTITTQLDYKVNKPTPPSHP